MGGILYERVTVVTCCYMHRVAERSSVRYPPPDIFKASDIKKHTLFMIPLMFQ